MTNTTKEDELRKSLRKLDSFRAINKEMLTHAVNVGGREVHIDYLLDQLADFIKQYGLEQRIDELVFLDSQRDTEFVGSKLFPSAPPMKVYKLPISTVWNRTAKLRSRLTALKDKEKE